MSEDLARRPRPPAIVLVALTGAATGASFIPSAAVGLTLASRFEISDTVRLVIASISVLIGGGLAVSLALWASTKLAGARRSRKTHFYCVGAGVLGLALGILIAGSLPGLGAAAMVGLTALFTAVVDSIFRERTQ